MINGFLRVAAVAPDHRVADVDFNVERIIDSIHSLEELGVDVAVFPELCITGYTCGDLFLNASLLDNAEKGLKRIAECSAKMHIDVIVGLPMICSGSRVSNCAALVSNGNVERYVEECVDSILAQQTKYSFFVTIITEVSFFKICILYANSERPTLLIIL